MEAAHAVRQKELLILETALLAGASHLVVADAGHGGSDEGGRGDGQALFASEQDFDSWVLDWWFGTCFLGCAGDIYLVFDAGGMLASGFDTRSTS